MKKEIATIYTKFDYSENWKEWNQAPNYPNFLEDQEHQEEWKKVFSDVIEKDINDALREEFPENQDMVISIENVTSNIKCVEISAYIFAILDDPNRIASIITIGKFLYEIIKPHLEKTFTKKLNEEAREILFREIS